VKKRLLVVVGALVAAQVLSGCYFLRELNWSKDKVEPGGSSVARIGLQPSSDVMARGGDDGYFFLTVLGDGEGIDFNRPVFDTADVTGQREKLVRDNALRDFVYENGNCGPFGVFRERVERGGVPAILWRTANPINSAPSRKLLNAKLKATAAQDSTGFGGIVSTGQWIDNGDGVPQEEDSDPNTQDDQIRCTGQTTTSLPAKGAQP
jgi:hypothetical protein